MASSIESAILHYTLSQYTQRPLYEVPSVTGSGGSPPPETPGIHCEKFSQWCEFFLSGAYGKANERDQNPNDRD